MARSCSAGTRRRCPYDQQSSAQEIIAIRKWWRTSAVASIVSRTGTPSSSATWQQPVNLVSVTLPGFPIDMMWRQLVPARWGRGGR